MLKARKGGSEDIAGMFIKPERLVKHLFYSKHEKKLRPIKGLDGM